MKYLKTYEGLFDFFWWWINVNLVFQKERLNKVKL